MKKRVWLVLLGCLAALVSADSQEVWGHEYDHDIPVYVDSIQRSLRYPLSFRESHASFRKWQKRGRAKLLECMGPPPPAPSGWNMEILAEEQREGYRAYRLSFSLSRWYRVKAYLLVPGDGGMGTCEKLPAVNLLHDHGAHLSIGKEKMVRPFAVDSSVVADADAWVAQLYDGQYLGDYLAAHGYVVLAADAPLWGERGRVEGVDRKKYDIIAGNMMMLGQDLCAYMHYDDVRTTEFLLSLPFVDKHRVGGAGCSMGGYRAWMLAALCPQVKATAVVCWMTTTATQLTTRFGRRENGGFANCIPGLRRWMDYPHIAALAAPRAMMVIAGTKDKLFPLEGVGDAFSQMAEVWQAAGVAGQLLTETADQPHECNKTNQQQILNFFEEKLK